MEIIALPDAACLARSYAADFILGDEEITAHNLTMLALEFLVLPSE